MSGIIYLEGQPVYTVNQEPLDENSEELLWQTASKLGLRTKRDQARNQISQMGSLNTYSQELRNKIGSIAENSRRSEATFQGNRTLYSAGKESNTIANQKLVEGIRSSPVAFAPFVRKAKKDTGQDFEQMFDTYPKSPLIETSPNMNESSEDSSSEGGITPVARFLYTPGLTYALDKGKEVVKAVCNSHPTLQKVCQSVKSYLPESMQAKRPRALVLTASADHSGLLTPSCYNVGRVQSLLELEKSYDVEYRKVSSLTDFCKAIDQSAKKVDPIECLVISAHGNERGISLSETESLQMGDDLSCLRNLSPQATVVIDSCSTGRGGKGEWNFANAVSYHVPESARVFSATDTTNYLRVAHRDQIEFQLWNTDLSPLNIFKGKAPISCKDVTYKIDNGEGRRDPVLREPKTSFLEFKIPPIDEARLVQDLMHDVNMLALPFKVVNQAIQKGCTLHPAAGKTCVAVAQTVRGVVRKIPGAIEAKRAIDSLKAKIEEAYWVKYQIPKEETRHFLNSVESLGSVFSGSIAGNGLQKTAMVLTNKIKQQRYASTIAREKLSTESFVRTSERLQTVTFLDPSSNGIMKYIYSIRKDGALRIFVHHLGAEIPQKSQGLFFKAIQEMKQLMKEHKAPLAQVQFLVGNVELFNVIKKKFPYLGQLETHLHEYWPSDTFLLVDRIRPAKEIPFLPHAGAVGTVSLVKKENTPTEEEKK